MFIEADYIKSEVYKSSLLLRKIDDNVLYYDWAIITWKQKKRKELKSIATQYIKKFKKGYLDIV